MVAMGQQNGSDIPDTRSEVYKPSLVFFLQCQEDGKGQLFALQVDNTSKWETLQYNNHLEITVGQLSILKR